MTTPPMPDHEPPEDEEPTFLDQLRGALLDTDGLDTVPAPSWVIHDVLARDSLAWLQGKPGDGKTFVALDMAGSVGAQVPWHTRWVKAGAGTHCTVLYIAAEGVSGMRQRVRAWEEHNGVDMTGVQWLPLPVQAGLDWQWDALIELAAWLGPVLIVIDTQARVTVGMEENAAKDMGVFVDGLERLRRATGACVLVVHHQGRNGEHMRGSTALEGAATTIIRVTKEDDRITLDCEKQKDAPDFDTIDFQLAATGESAVLREFDSMTASGAGYAAAMKIVEKWFANFGTDKVSVTKLVDAEIATKRTLYRHLRTLVEHGVAGKQELGNHVYYWLIIDDEADEPDPKGSDRGSDSATCATPKGVVAHGTHVTEAHGTPLALVAQPKKEHVNGQVSAKEEDGTTPEPTRDISHGVPRSPRVDTSDMCAVCGKAVPPGHRFCSRECAEKDRAAAWADWGQ